VRSESLATIGLLVAGTAHELNNPLTSAISLIQSTVEDMARSPALGGNRRTTRSYRTSCWLAGSSPGQKRSSPACWGSRGRPAPTARRSIWMRWLSRMLCACSRINSNPPARPSLRSAQRQSARITGNYAGLGAGDRQSRQERPAGRSPGRWPGPRLATYYEPQGHHVVFSCRDTGPGITRAVRQDMFKPFFTTKDVGARYGPGAVHLPRNHTRSTRGLHRHYKASREKALIFKVKLPIHTRRDFPLRMGILA
jgi:signal transduction histidine kinase